MIDHRIVVYRREDGIFNCLHLYVRLGVVLVPQYNLSLWRESQWLWSIASAMTEMPHVMLKLSGAAVLYDEEQTLTYSVEKPFYTQIVLKRSSTNNWMWCDHLEFSSIQLHPVAGRRALPHTCRLPDCLLLWFCCSNKFQLCQLP